MTDLTYAALDALEAPHLIGHTCAAEADGLSAWWNPNAGRREACPTLANLLQLRHALDALTQQVHAAAHDTDAVDRVASAMLLTPVAELEPEVAAGWRYMAQLGIEALSEHLDPALP